MSGSSMPSITAQKISTPCRPRENKHTEGPEVNLRIAIEDMLEDVKPNKQRRQEKGGKGKGCCCLEAIRDLARSALPDVVDVNALEIWPITMLLIVADKKLPVHFLPTTSRKGGSSRACRKNTAAASIHNFGFITSFQLQHQQHQAGSQTLFDDVSISNTSYLYLHEHQRSMRRVVNVYLL